MISGKSVVWGRPTVCSVKKFHNKKTKEISKTVICRFGIQKNGRRTDHCTYGLTACWLRLTKQCAADNTCLFVISVPPQAQNNSGLLPIVLWYPMAAIQGQAPEKKRTIIDRGARRGFHAIDTSADRPLRDKIFH